MPLVQGAASAEVVPLNHLNSRAHMELLALLFNPQEQLAGVVYDAHPAASRARTLKPSSSLVSKLRSSGAAADGDSAGSGGGWPFGSSLRVFGSQSDGLSVGSGAGLADAVRGEERGRVVSADVGQG
eukprot:CAMPEP_0181171598 /NCGR_PEP_ID=MMETSP1096-20121128/1997_1 /TAXON_ID=156174 ORGANISM="Chrysochromulina ericina, Strain CCMP281" /NCGR_SAMPLE_ID=MMETSP1096 /ASSEMBLY_ACC=CAM_ASM_000453 /LENGTH=126 /DNA_ID=CAMNT_0023259261 /DNA_START=254 /DNA_END=631 /DNA_ORIENTATION=-